MFVFLLATAVANAQPACAGMVIVGGWGVTVPLVDVHNQVAIELKVDKGLLPQPLKVLACDTTRYLVEYQGQKYAVDKVRVRYSQGLGPCVPDLGGKAETHTNADSMGLVDPNTLKCPASSKSGAPAAASSKK